jgi:hypothetical protein
MKPELSRFPEDIVCLDTVEELTNLISQIETSGQHDERVYLPSVFTEPFSVEATVPAAIIRNRAGDTSANRTDASRGEPAATTA